MDENIVQLGKTDIYIIDQLMKGRIRKEDSLLDAGFGRGRNLEYFVRNNYNISGIDLNPEYLPIILDQVKTWNPAYPRDKFSNASVASMPFQSESFDFVFCVAVLHFAKSHDHFWTMLNELLRVLKKGGFLLFRMTSWHTFDHVPRTNSGLVTIADGERYMLDIEDFRNFTKEKGYSLVEPIKTTNVDGLRAMTTILSQK
jgi:ubiquinone/menaquinone biosynthesis C-methylase UbiE